MSSPVIGDASKALSTWIWIFLQIKKNTHPHKVYSNHFRLSTWKRYLKRWKYDWWCIYDVWHHCIRKPLFSSVHLQTKGWCFQRFQPWRAFLKRCVFGDRIEVDSRPNRTKSNVFFQTKRMRVDRAYYYFLCELPDVIKLIMPNNQTLCPALASSQKWNPCYSRLAYCTDLHIRLSYII